LIANLEELIKGCKSKKIASQSALYKLYEEQFFVLSLKYCRNQQEAQDNLQDSFLEIFKRIKQYKGTGSFEGWMKRIVINKAIDRYKKELRKQPLEEHIQTDEPVELEEHLNIPLDQILRCIQNLPAQYRLVFNLYVMDGYSHKEIAQMLSISTGTSKSNLHRAKLILKQQIEALKQDE
jgi:RNA polymerase sigma-70 factor (ECF subfamily)